MTDLKKLADEIIAGRRLGKDEDLDFLFFCRLDDLRREADRIRRALCGSHADICTIINGRSGKCSENCKFCAQSAHHHTGIEEYGFLDEENILKECKHNEAKGVNRFSIVTAGRTLNGEDFEKALSAYKRLSRECSIGLCASLGLLTREQFTRLYENGVRVYHCNLETSRNYFPHICTTHSYDDKIKCIKTARECGLSVCSGGILGIGENTDDRLEMALELAELGVRSVPINILKPIKGTPLENMKPLDREDILRTVAIYRFILPDAYIRLAAGRETLKNAGEEAFLSGANAAITGDMLTTTGSNIASDIEMLSKLQYMVGSKIQNA